MNIDLSRHLSKIKDHLTIVATFSALLFLTTVILVFLCFLNESCPEREREGKGRKKEVDLSLKGYNIIIHRFKP